MNKKNLPHKITVAAFVVFIVLGLACASTPTAQIVLGTSYQKYLQQPVGNERRIDSVGLRGSTSFVCRDGQHNVTSTQRLGATYELGGQATTKKKAAAAAVPSERHRHEPVLDRLLNEVKRQYPNENVDMRNAKTSRHIPTNARLEEYEDRVSQSDGSYVYVTRTRTIWDCFPYYIADVITTEPWPQPVAHSENFTKPGATRNDINRLALNWLEDNTTSRRIKIESQDFDRGRIRGTVQCATRTTDQTYIITSAYTIDVFDARVEIKFDEAILQRIDLDTGIITGNPEKIFLQSIADAAAAELIDFSTTLRSYILSR